MFASFLFSSSDNDVDAPAKGNVHARQPYNVSLQLVLVIRQRSQPLFRLTNAHDVRAAGLSGDHNRKAL
jgi:hypothetical protein